MPINQRKIFTFDFDAPQYKCFGGNQLRRSTVSAIDKTSSVDKWFLNFDNDLFEEQVQKMLHEREKQAIATLDRMIEQEYQRQNKKNKKNKQLSIIEIPKSPQISEEEHKLLAQQYQKIQKTFYSQQHEEQMKSLLEEIMSETKMMEEGDKLLKGIKFQQVWRRKQTKTSIDSKSSSKKQHSKQVSFRIQDQEEKVVVNKQDSKQQKKMTKLNNKQKASKTKYDHQIPLKVQKKPSKKRITQKSNQNPNQSQNTQKQDKQQRYWLRPIKKLLPIKNSIENTIRSISRQTITSVQSIVNKIKQQDIFKSTFPIKIKPKLVIQRNQKDSRKSKNSKKSKSSKNSKKNSPLRPISQPNRGKITLFGESRQRNPPCKYPVKIQREWQQKHGKKWYQLSSQQLIEAEKSMQKRFQQKNSKSSKAKFSKRKNPNQ